MVSFYFPAISEIHHNTKSIALKSGQTLLFLKTKTKKLK